MSKKIDQPEVHSAWNEIRDSNLAMISVAQIPADKDNS
jgi:hypothetical protein